MQRRTGIQVGGCLVLLALGVGALFEIGVFPTRGMYCFGRTTFSAPAWRAAAGQNGPVTARGCMVDDYLRRHPPVGRTRAEILRELGQPRPTSYFREYDLVYWLGSERGFMAIDSEWLVIRFDSAGRAIEGRLVTD